jgi:putative hydrolase of the HAD superfamily
MIKAIIFDFYGVFCSDLTLNWFTKIVPNYEDLIGEFHAICTLSDYGKVTKQEFHEKLHDLTGIPTDKIVEGIKAEAQMNDKVIELARSLKKNYKIALMSNATDEWITPLLEENNMNDIFDNIIVSANVGIAKPERGIFEYTLKELDVTASEAIFVDDRLKNVDGGNDAGIKSILFTNYDDFIVQLKSANIIL